MNIIPIPRKYTMLSGKFVLRDNTLIFADKKLMDSAKFFVQIAKQTLGVQLTFIDSLEQADIVFALQEQGELRVDEYEISIAERTLNIIANNNQASFWAVQSLLQLFVQDDNGQIVAKCCHIMDRPQYEWRGLSLDVARHFVSVSTIEQSMRLMARLKLNKLHLHLTDDQGFRVEISRYPQINKVSSYRQGTFYRKGGKQYILEQDNYGGYYTKQDIAHLVKLAKTLHIDIIPEVDIPGHCVALLASMPEYSCQGTVSEVRTTWGISKDLLCVGKDNTLQVIKDIITEVAEMFPSQYFHLGGDETPKDRWCNCKLCTQKLSQLKLHDFDQLQSWFVNQVKNHLKQLGKTVICWNDGVNDQTDSDIISQHWKMHSIKNTVKQINKGRLTIMSPFYDMYFDYPYAMTPLSKTYRMKVVPTGTKSKNKHNVLGVEGALWTEYVDNDSKLYFQLLPRLHALAECAWGTNNNYRNFVKRAKNDCKFLQKNGIIYNDKAWHSGNVFGRLKTVKQFFASDADIEFNKYITDKSEEQPNGKD